jgi:hypothetical protein
MTRHRERQLVVSNEPELLKFGSRAIAGMHDRYMPNVETSIRANLTREEESILQAQFVLGRARREGSRCIWPRALTKSGNYPKNTWCQKPARALDLGTHHLIDRGFTTSQATWRDELQGLSGHVFRRRTIGFVPCCVHSDTKLRRSAGTKVRHPCFGRSA